MRRRRFIALIGALAITRPLGAHAQQLPSALLKRIGLLTQLPCQDAQRWWADHLSQVGWIEGQNCVFECVSAIGHLDQIPALARQLVSRQPDVLIATPGAFLRALKQETTTIPIVMSMGVDPVRTGLVTSLARPEGNVTGVAYFGFDILPKRIELLKETVPHLRRLAIVGGAYFLSESIKIIEENLTISARTLGFAWQRFQPGAARDYDEIFTHIAAEHFDAAYIQTDAIANQPESAARISELALQHRIPTIGDTPELSKAGLLLTYYQVAERGAARVSQYVDKILRGAKPSDLPIEQATELLLVINLRTAKTLGLTLPPSLIARADEVIE